MKNCQTQVSVGDDVCVVNGLFKGLKGRVRYMSNESGLPVVELQTNLRKQFYGGTYIFTHRELQKAVK